MSCKWNEELVINFLKAYKQHPCLWNPYHKDYYNCYEKNEALKKIIINLGIPGFTVTDYLHQIKTIREKYKHEQMETIKSLQSQKQYKSPVPWYNIMTDMLTEVIDDEEKVKQQKNYSIPRSLSSDNVRNQKKEKTGMRAKSSKFHPCNNATCDKKSRRSKSVEKAVLLSGKSNSTNKPLAKLKNDKRVRYAVFPQYKASEYKSRDLENTCLCCKPTKDTELDVNVGSTSNILKAKYSGPCSLTRNDSESNETLFLKCPLCGWEEATDNKPKKIKESDSISYCGCKKDVNSMMCALCTESDNVTRHDISHPLEYSTENISNFGDFEFLLHLLKQSYIISRKSKTESQEAIKKFIDAEVQHDEVSQEISKNSSTGLTLQAEVVRDDPIVDNKFKCGTVEACSWLNIILSSSKKNIKINNVVTEDVQNDKQLTPVVEAECLERGTHVSLTDNFPESKRINIAVSTVTNVEKRVQNMIEKPDIMRSSVYIQTLNQTKQNNVKEDKCSSKCSTTSKEVAVNIVDQVSKGVQSKVCVSRGCLCSSTSLEKVIDVGTAMSIHSIHSVGCLTTENVKKFQSKCIQYTIDNKFLPCNREKYCRSIQCNIQDSDFSQPSETNVHEFDDRSTTDICSSNILNAIKANHVVAAFLQKMLQSVIIKNDQTTQSDHEYEPKGNCLIDTSTSMNTAEEYMLRSLELNLSDNSNVKEVSETLVKEESPRRIEKKQDDDNRLNMTEESVFVQGAEVPKEYSLKVSPNSVMEICTCLKHRDFDSNGSKFHVRDVETQSCAQLMKDLGCSTNYERKEPEKISIGTQKRDPILVRLIKCTGSQAIVRSDKETVTVGLNVDKEGKSTDKRVETCGRKTCVPLAIYRKLKEANLEKATSKKYVDKTTDNYYRRCVTFHNDICNRNCRENLSYDWTDIRNRKNFKIPLCVRSSKNVLPKNK